MPTGAITSHIDVAQVALYAFWIFFAGLIFYLRREDRREGYPLEDDTTGVLDNQGVVWMPPPKTFQLVDGHTYQAPDPDAPRDPRDLPARRMAPWPGAPLVPTGDPMIDGLGPAAYANRAEEAERTFDGKPLLMPLRNATEFEVAEGDPDPRGMVVTGADGKTAGRIVDIWVDRSEYIFRYYEMEETVSEVPRRVLLPINFAVVDSSQRRIKVNAIMGRHFATVPPLRNPDEVTLREEDRICAYFAGGYLYASPDRVEPLV